MTGPPGLLGGPTPRGAIHLGEVLGLPLVIIGEGAYSPADAQVDANTRKVGNGRTGEEGRGHVGKVRGGREGRYGEG